MTQVTTISGRIILFIFLAFGQIFLIQKRKFSHFFAKQKRKTEKNSRTFLFAKTKISTLFAKKWCLQKIPVLAKKRPCWEDFFVRNKFIGTLFLWQQSLLQHFFVRKNFMGALSCEKNLIWALFGREKVSWMTFYL